MLVLTTVLNYVAWTIVVATLVTAAALILRMALQWSQANPFGWFALNLRRVTEPIMRPFRYGFDNRMLRFDFLPIVAAALVLLNGLFAASLIWQLMGLLDLIDRAAVITIGLVLGSLVWLFVLFYMTLLFVRFLLPMLGFGYSNRFFRFAFAMTEPILKPLRQYLIFGAFDFSPLVVLFAIQFLGGFLRDVLMRM